MENEQSDLEAAINSSRNAYFAHRAHMQPTPAFLQLFSDAFELGAEYAMDAAPQPNAALADGWAAGVEAVAKMLEKGADDFAAEHGYDDMGCLSFGRGAKAEVRMDYHSGLLELADQVRAMLPAPPTLNAKDQS